MGFDINLIGMNAADVVRQAVLLSGKGQEEIEAEAGLRAGILDQYASRHDTHWPNMPVTPRLCRALGNDLIIQWQVVQHQAGAVRRQAPAMPAAAILRETVISASEFGDQARAVESALKDAALTRKERMAIRREAQELAARLLRLVDDVSGGL